MGNPAKIESLIAPTLEDMGFDIVRIEMMGQEGRILQIMAERKDEEAMNQRLILDAILGIQDGQNPKVIGGILKNYLAESKRKVDTEE